MPAEPYCRRALRNDLNVGVAAENRYRKLSRTLLDYQSKLSGHMPILSINEAKKRPLEVKESADTDTQQPQPKMYVLRCSLGPNRCIHNAFAHHCRSCNYARRTYTSGVW